jgi:undecaprenyl-diphosphatase
MPLYRFDMDWFRAIHIGWHSPILDPIFLVLSYMGLGQVEGLFAILLYCFPRTRRFGLPLLITVLATLISSDLTKKLIPRDRPSVLGFSHPQEPWLGNSFPSGHTTCCFAFAFMVMFMTMGTRRAWAGWVALMVAFLIGLSRIYRGIHWPSDVIAGIFIGCATAAIVYLIMDWVQERKRKEAA